MGSEKVILIVDDFSAYADSLTGLFKTLGYSVIVASSKEQVKAIIVQIRDSGARVAIVDGNLSEDSFGCYDGAEVAKILRENIPGIFIIAHSASDNYFNYGDIKVSKQDGSQVLLDVIGRVFC